ncbi:14689_t:CDS:10, partial [Entrophospora sp. SA101]
VYEPTVFENYVYDIWIDNQQIELSLWDTAGQEEFDRLRTLSYADTHVVMMCFSVDNRDSLDNIDSKWMQEILEHCEGVKIVLVALKCDLREDKQVIRNMQRYGEKPVTYEEGLTVARNIQAARYLECSAKHNRGVREAFEQSARVSIHAKPKGIQNHVDEKTCVDLQQMVLHCLTDDVKSGSWIEIRKKDKIKRIVVIAISSFGANLFDISDNKKEMDNHEIKDKLAVFPKIFGLGCVINSQFNKLEQFLTVDLTNGNIKGRLVKSFQNTRETEKPVKLLLRGDIMPFYEYKSPIYPEKEGHLPDGWVQTTLDSAYTNSTDKLLFVGCKVAINSAHIVIIDYEQNIICDEWFRIEHSSASDNNNKELNHGMKSLKNMQNLLLSLITRNTKLVGHCLSNYLKLLKYAHPHIIDTSILYQDNNELYSRPTLSFLKATLYKITLEVTNTPEEEANAILSLYKYTLERGPYVGKSKESLINVLNISNRSTVFIDHRDKFQLFGGGSTSNANLVLCTNDEEALIEKSLLENIKRSSFVWAHFRDLKRFPNGEDQLKCLKAINDRIDNLYNKLSTNSVLMVIGEPKKENNEKGIAFIRVKN